MNRYILGKSAKIAYSEYLITWLKLLDVYPNRFNPPRYVISENLVFWF
jgi:hypothetical protein